MTESDLIDRYVRLAKAQGEASTTGRASEANEAFRQLELIKQEILAEGRFELLINLADHDDPWVRLWVAHHLRGHDEDRSHAIVWELTQSEDPFVSLIAEWAIRDLGLQPPG